MRRPIPKVVFSRPLNSVAGNARVATDDIGTEVRRLRDQQGDGEVRIGGAGLADRLPGKDSSVGRKLLSGREQVFD